MEQAANGLAQEVEPIPCGNNQTDEGRWIGHGIDYAMETVSTLCDSRGDAFSLQMRADGIACRLMCVIFFARSKRDRSCYRAPVIQDMWNVSNVTFGNLLDKPER